MSFSDFYRFYCDFVDRINIYNASKYQEDVFSNNIDAIQIKTITDQIESVDRKILELSGLINKEQHFNKKTKMNIEINKLRKRKIKLIEQLK